MTHTRTYEILCESPKIQNLSKWSELQVANRKKLEQSLELHLSFESSIEMHNVG